MVSGFLCWEIRGDSSTSGTMGSVAVSGSQSNTRATLRGVGSQMRPNSRFRKLRITGLAGRQPC